MTAAAAAGGTLAQPPRASPATCHGDIGNGNLSPAGGNAR
jgi:hypothetical protein